MVLARDPGIVRQHPADAQHRNFLSVNVLHGLEGLVNIAPAPVYPILWRFRWVIVSSMACWP